jgi:phosphatidyl-myo-inositol dimannoside synthase
MKNTLFIILCSEYPPNMYGGIAQWAENLHDTLSKSGYDTIVLTHKNRQHKKLKVRSTKTVRYISGHDWKKLHWLYRLPALIKLLLTHKNVVLIPATWDELQVIHHFKPLFHFRIYCSSHGTDITKHVFPRKEKTIRKINKIFSSVDLFMPVSQSLDRLTRSMFPNITYKSIVLGCNINTTIFCPVPDQATKTELRKQFGINDQCHLMITIGRMMAVKGFRHIIMALPDIRKTIPDICYMIVAKPDEPEIMLIEHLVKELHLEKHVIIQPPINNKKLPQLLQTADLFVLTSEPVYFPHYQEEGLPRVIPEASSCGLPVIVSTTGGLAEAVVNNETGFIVHHGDQEALKTSIRTLLTNGEKAKEMGMKGRQYVLKHFSDEVMKTKILSIAEQE